MKTKEEVIKEAWLDSEAPYLEYNNTDGWSIRHDIKHKDININCFDWVCNLGGYKIRPKSLKGIENNNMWIRIESEDDLPKTQSITEEIHCFIKSSDNEIIGMGKFSFGSFKTFFGNNYENVTHYQPIVKPNKPLY